MTTTTAKVSAKYQITIPEIARKNLNIQKGDHLLMDVQDGMIILIPKPSRVAAGLQGLHSDIWKDVDVQSYINGERDAWMNSTSK